MHRLPSFKSSKDDCITLICSHDSCVNATSPGQCNGLKLAGRFVVFLVPGVSLGRHGCHTRKSFSVGTGSKRVPHNATAKLRRLKLSWATSCTILLQSGGAERYSMPVCGKQEYTSTILRKDTAPLSSFACVSCQEQWPWRALPTSLVLPLQVLENRVPSCTRRHCV